MKSLEWTLQSSFVFSHTFDYDVLWWEKIIEKIQTSKLHGNLESGTETFH